MDLAERNDPSEDAERLLARLAVKGQVVSAEKMEELLSFQQGERDCGRTASLEEILVNNGLVTEKQLDSLRSARTFLLKREQDRIFCRILVKVEYVTQEKIDLALMEQQKIYKEKQHFKPILDILLEKGAINSKKKDAVINAADRLKKGRPRGVPAVRNGGAGEAGDGEAEREIEPPSQVWECDRAAERVRFDPRATVLEEEFFDIIVSSDMLEAYVALKGDMPGGMNAAAIRVMLLAHGIHGIAPEEAIEDCLRNRDANKGIFKVARGVPAREGKSATLKYHFRSRPGWDELIASKVTVDFKNRGDIPQVKEGSLLAEKIPMIEEDAGVDVYGKPFPVEKARDVKLLAGAGVELSPDGLKAHAATDGRPEISPFGKLSVFPELNINGDIDFETGNVEFNGHIVVNGVVQDGFRVKGGSLTAKEISKASVEVIGEVVVYGGILAADIKAQGGVSAFHIHASRIECLGDVVAEKGIVDSKIITAGKCLAPRGTILSSSISAKMGFETAQIGSYRSGPCMVTFGVDVAAQREIELRRENVGRLEKERAEMAAQIRNSREKYARIEKSAGELAQLQDRSVREQRALSDELKRWREAGNREEASRVESVMNDLTLRMKSKDSELDILLDQQDTIRADVAACQARLREITKEAHGLKEEIAAFTNWSQNQKEKPYVKVSGLITAGTTIKGQNTSTVLRSDSRGVLVKEVVVSSEEGGPATGFKMQISNLF